MKSCCERRSLDSSVTVPTLAKSLVATVPWLRCRSRRLHRQSRRRSKYKPAGRLPDAGRRTSIGDPPIRRPRAAVRTCDDALLRIDAAKKDAYDDSPPASSRAPRRSSRRAKTWRRRRLAELINLGLSLGTSSGLGGVEGVSAEAIHLSQRLLTASNTGMVPLGRQTSLGLDLVSRRGAGATELDVSPVLVALKAEVDDPPDRFRDPIMLTLMDEPVVISSGHHFDRATLYDARDRFRFKQCPMTRCDIEPRAYPLVYLKRELVEWKLARLDKVLEAAAACQAAPAAQLLAFAKQLIDSLGGDTYQHRAAQYWKLRCAVIADEPKAMVEALVELAAALGRGGGSNVATFEELTTKYFGLVSATFFGEGLSETILPKLRPGGADGGGRCNVRVVRPSWVGGWLDLISRLYDEGSTWAETN